MSKARRIAGRLFKLAVAGGLLYYVFRVVPFAEVLHSLRSAQPGKVAAGLALLFVARLIAAVRMKALTDKQGLSFSLSEIFESRMAYPPSVRIRKSGSPTISNSMRSM